eukprot:gene17414-22963_t
MDKQALERHIQC